MNARTIDRDTAVLWQAVAITVAELKILHLDKLAEILSYRYCLPEICLDKIPAPPTDQENRKNYYKDRIQHANETAKASQFNRRTVHEVAERFGIFSWEIEEVEKVLVKQRLDTLRCISHHM